MNASVPPAAAPLPVSPAERARGRRTLLLIFAVSIAPVLAALFAMFVWRPGGSAVHGNLVEPPQALTLDGAEAAGEPLRDAMLGKWTLLVRAPGACDQACQDLLWVSRQVRTLQAKQMDRVLRVWVVEDAAAIPDGLLAEHADLLVVRSSALAQQLAAGRVSLADPRANVMLHYVPPVDAKGMVKDLQKLLKFAR